MNAPLGFESLIPRPSVAFSPAPLPHLRHYFKETEINGCFHIRVNYGISRLFKCADQILYNL